MTVFLAGVERKSLLFYFLLCGYRHVIKLSP